MTPVPQVRLLIFDGTCGFCAWAAAWVERRLPADASAVPWQETSDLGAVGLSAEDVSRAVYWIDVNRRAHRGHRAASEALRAIGGGWKIFGTLIAVPPLSWVAALAYELVSRNRHRLSKLIRSTRR